MYQFFKTIAFQFDPELAHSITVKTLALLPSVFSMYGGIDNLDKYQIETNMGVLPFPVGIAAGLDKNAELIDYFGQLGVGGLEVGTVTPLPQEGNQKPRLFRMAKERSLRNCMGFNGDGAKSVLANIEIANDYPMKLGINFGKNKITPNDKALNDYLILFKEFEQVGDYYVINVSSPNTPGLRDLQDKDFILALNQELIKMKVSKPVYLKISPDMSMSQIDQVINVVGESIFSGIIATNTTHIPELGAGGVSGRMIREKSREVRKAALIRMSAFKDKEVIGVGGVESIEDLWEFWSLGGKFMQVYSSFIFNGPKLFTSLSQRLDWLMNYYGVTRVEELIRLAYLEKVKLPIV